MPFLKLFDFLPGWVWAIIAVTLMATACAEKNLHNGTKLKLAEVKTQVAQEKAAQEKAAREATEANRKTEQVWQQASKEIRDVVVEEQRKTAVAVQSAAATRSMLVSATAALTTYRRGSGEAPASVKRAEQTTAAIGELPAICDAVAEDLGRKAEDLATQVRGLIREYEKLLVPSHPLADRDQVDPRAAALRNGVVDSALPVLSADTSVDGELRFIRE